MLIRPINRPKADSKLQRSASYDMNITQIIACVGKSILITTGIIPNGENRNNDKSILDSNISLYTYKA